MQSVASLLKNARQYSKPLFGDFTHASLFPIPLPQRIPQIAVLICRAEVTQPKVGMSLWAPSQLMTLSLESGEFLELRRVRPTDFGRQDSTEEPIGQVRRDDDPTDPDQLKNRMNLWRTLDLMLPAFFDPRQDPPPRDQKAAFSELFGKVAEPALQPYYTKLGGKFFEWLRA